MADFDQLWNYDQPAQTEARFRDLLPAAAAGPDRAYHAELLSQIARAQGLQGHFAEGHATLDEAEAMLADTGSVARIRCLLERGRLFRSARVEPKKALLLFRRAWIQGIAAGHEEYAVDAAHMLGIAEPEPETRLSWNLKALEVAEESPRARRWLGSLYNNIGWTYAEDGQYEEALAIFEKGVTFREEQGAPGPLRIARWAVAKMHRLLGRAEEALALQEALLTEAEEAGAPDGFIHEELGESLLALGREDEARSHFARAFDLLSQMAWLAEGEPERLKRLQRLGS